jgi:exopolysaccharide production protein ExoY
MPAQHFELSRSDPRSMALPFWKRTLDMACCIAALPLLVFTTLLMAVVVKIGSPGPIFFRQERIGYRGHRFQLYKFRTMHIGVETESHQAHIAQLFASKAPMLKLDSQHDRRLIPGGRWLRASGLDELPQLINVLRGEMSIVGPRPCLPYEFARYSSWHRKRLHSAPGLTGLWQVSGKNRTTFEEMIRLDVLYAERRSASLDVWIIMRTVPALCAQLVDAQKTQKVVKSAKQGPGQSVAVSAPR